VYQSDIYVCDILMATPSVFTAPRTSLALLYSKVLHILAKLEVLTLHSFSAVIESQTHNLGNGDSSANFIPIQLGRPWINVPSG
jgi:hypothetical protein